MTASCTNDTLRVIRIVDGTIVDGPGLRTSIYLAGCRHECPGCHNPQSWPADAGHDMTIQAVMDRVRANDMNVTLTGGDPLYQASALLPLCHAIKEIGKTIWCYTGYTYEAVSRDKTMCRILDLVDVLVDGPYVDNLRDLTLRFRGSANQRLVDVRQSTPGHVVTWKE